MQPLIQKYRPKSTKDIEGQDEQISKLQDFIVNYQKQKKKAALIYGSSGVGKTSSVCSIAQEIGYEVIEVNASDFRNAEQINQKVGNAIKQRSLFAPGKIILVDDVDGLSGQQDRGGLQEIIRLMEKSTFPIILTVQDPFDNKFSTLRSKSNMIHFNSLDHNSIFKILKRIAEKEKIGYDEETLKSFARRSGGDARGAINDFQTITQGKKELKKEDFEDISDRVRTEKIMTALNKIFKTTDMKIAINALENVEEDTSEQFLWIDENLPKEYTNPKDLARAYDMISKADVFNRRIRRWQHWRFLVYVNALLSAGIASAKDEKYRNFVEYKPTGRILKIWWANQKQAKKKAIAEKIASKTHSSKKDILKNTISYIPLMFKNKEMKKSIISELDLNEEEIEWVEKQIKV